MLRKLVSLFLVSGIALLLIASVYPSSQVATVAQATQQSADVIVTQNPVQGKILTDSNGMSLYVFAKDKVGVSNCTDKCATTWPPFTVPDGVTPTGSGDVTATLGTIKRADGTNQITADGIPLYHFSKDTKPGDTNGQGVLGIWFLVDASGNAIVPPPATATPIPTPKPSNGGGYGGGGGMGGGRRKY